jgi:ABC-type glutathione transport system ATPase component
MAAATQSGAPVLELDNVRISYFTRAGEINVVPGVSFRLAQGEAIGLVGESGCGKSTVAFSIMKYLGGAGRLTGGRILFEGRDMAKMSEEELRKLRGQRMAMVYQDPMSSLNPVITVGRQLMEVPIIHQGAGEAEARRRALQMLAEVKLPDAESVFDRYPHQLSGGQQQRVVIAMALMAEPSLLVMDEPTTGLDVTVEAAVLDLVRGCAASTFPLVFTSHNLGTVVRVCDRIGVMYAGDLVEEGRSGRCSAIRATLYARPARMSCRCSAATSIPRRWCRFPARCRRRSIVRRAVSLRSLQACGAGRCTSTRIETIAIPGESVHASSACVALNAVLAAAARLAAAVAEPISRSSSCSISTASRSSTRPPPASSAAPRPTRSRRSTTSACPPSAA